LHPLLSLFLMLLGFLSALTTTAFAIAYQSWLIYSIPFTVASTIGWFVSRSRKDDGVQHDEKNYDNSSKAFDWLVTKFKEDDKE